jgi:hypothetical protein
MCHTLELYTLGVTIKDVESVTPEADRHSKALNRVARGDQLSSLNVILLLVSTK